MMTSHPTSPAADARPAVRSAGRMRPVVACLAVGSTLAAAAVLATPNVAAADAPLSPSISGDLLDELATPDHITIARTLAEDGYSFDGELIRVSDPAPLGPFLAEPEATSKQGGENPQFASMSEAFSLHTRPSASRKIFLDFDGHVTTDTLWNNSSNTPIVSGIYSRESSPDDSFSTYELDGIIDIWAQVAEDFAAWDVDVTTEDPGVEGLIRSSSADTEYGIRVVVSQDSAWYGPYGGAAYLRSFSRNSDLPAFVFSSNLINGLPKSVAEAISHEVGHSFDLRHDAEVNSDGSVSGYYSGHGDWAPIMGVGYYRDITQWSKGEYANASNTEDDLAKIDTYVDRLPDLSGSTAHGGDGVTIHAMVEGGETQSHQVIVTEGPVVIGIDKLDPTGNLHADLTIRNSVGDIVASDAPTNASNWSLEATLPEGIAAGSYSVEVRSIGWLTASTGFTSYASVGEYAMSIDAPGTAPTTTTTTTVPGDTTTTTEPDSTTTTVSGNTTTTEPGTDPTTDPTTTTTTPSTDPAGPPTGPTTPTTEPPTTERPPSTGDRFSGISPERLLDTRSPDSDVSRLRADDRVRLDPLNIASVDQDATAVVLNIVAVNPADTGFISVTPCTPIDPDMQTSSLNFAPGRNVGNSIIAPTASDGTICLDASAATDLVVDITGWIGASGATALVDLTAQRVVDTRRDIGGSGRLTADSTTTFSLDALVDASTDSVSINVTAVSPDVAGFVAVDDCVGDSTTSALNFAADETRGNNGVFALGPNKTLCVTTSADTHLTIDVTGQFGTGDGLTFVASSPVRILDTREGGRVAPGASTGFDVPRLSTSGGFTVSPAAASVNLASVRHGDGSYVTSWDCGDRPDTSALNTITDAPTANSVLVPVATSGRSCLFHAGGGDLIVDLTGWWI